MINEDSRAIMSTYAHNFDVIPAIQNHRCLEKFKKNHFKLVLVFANFQNAVSVHKTSEEEINLVGFAGGVLFNPKNVNGDKIIL